ncbi:hypothetical protein HRR83_001179 [Exophiala dermatitidis]|uniref:Flavin reductase like domain-containing protein n=2 Tax=Exophiala dermatitidis TaxID=5970 RepID=H6C748_EXODN|nr:uncharacterized protein HMPREF1120_07532 [Exophiala dermatitidis NIH/UT8656]KAJ4525990.1 hypothetical protein HRR74_001183 [Exophiala dermatitidis]EHY59544.1 hypothetical protein HMPREF1120_07532 [Exophiala dermatitidis NIH/UT8656]KAJ4527064.1 hypothetical protein HRR73_001861 [Exophiala dermatitidis]KAJ4532782.1 hypothetical protein HRR76_007763 [Exophiala dermatitidis]KAJ4573925.1 hypothetical protein HRR79_002934 [Exophiala dermatitidis]
MFYEPSRTEHNLPYDPFKACVVPRPIGWISTVSPPTTGTSTSPTRIPNLAPYSQFNNLTFDPPYIMFSANQTPTSDRKDTVLNVEATGVFCWQLATWDLREAVNKTAQQLPYGVDEFEHAGLSKTWSKVLNIPVPMVAESPVRFECVYHSTLRLPGNPPMGTVDVVIGKVVGVHVDDRVLTNGKIDVRKTQPIARCGYYEYAVIRDTFDMIIPGDPATLFGLEGNVKQHRQHRETAQRAAGDNSIPSS